MAVKHELPLVLLKENSGHLRTKYIEQYVNEFIITKKEHGEKMFTKNYRKKWK